MANGAIDQADAHTLEAHDWELDAERDGFLYFVHVELEGERIRIEGKGWVHFDADGHPLAHSRYGRTLQDYLDPAPAWEA